MASKKKPDRTQKKPVPRIRRRPSEQDASFARVDERLLGAIERVLTDGASFGALTVEQLAREAGIGRATFYLHFKDKGELVQRLMRQLTAEVVDNAGAWFREGAEVDRRSMRLALHGIVSTFRRHAAVLAAVTDIAAHDPAVAAAHAQMMDELCRLSRKAIAQVRRDGRGTALATPELGDLLTWSIEMYCARFVAGYDGKRLETLIDLIAHVCGRAIFAGDETPA